MSKIKSVKEIVITKDEFRNGFKLKEAIRHGREIEVLFRYVKNKNDLLRAFAELVLSCLDYENIYCYIVKIQGDPRIGLASSEVKLNRWNKRK